jgi:hypothetical protein
MLYYRISQARPFFRWATIFVGVIVNISGLIVTFLNIFRCHPVSAAFKPTSAFEVPPTCIDIFSLYLASAPINILTDIALLVLPLPLLTSMRLEMRSKVGLVLTFIAGVFVTVVDVVRISYLQAALVELIALIGAGKGLDGDIPDFSWHASYSFMWSAIEVNVGLICACVLVIKPLVVRIHPRKSAASSHHASTNPSLPMSSRQADGPEVKPERSSGGDDDGSAEMQSHAVPSAGMAENSVHSNPSPFSTQPDSQGEDDDRLMDLIEFFNTADGLVEQPAFAATSPARRARRLTSISILDRTHSRRISSQAVASQVNGQVPPTTFADFVNIGDKKPLTQLTKREAWWPIVFGRSTFVLTLTSSE